MLDGRIFECYRTWGVGGLNVIMTLIHLNMLGRRMRRVLPCCSFPLLTPHSFFLPVANETHRPEGDD